MTVVSFDAPPAMTPPLDPEFRPTALARRAFARAVNDSGDEQPLTFALERDGGAVARFATHVLPTRHPRAEENLRQAERTLKFLLWQRGAHTVHVAGPQDVVAHLERPHAPGGARAFDARSEEHTSELQSRPHLVCRLL